jgi:catechol-2,3-dioxygenase
MKIKELTLLTSNLENIKSFYSNILKLKISKECKDFIEFIIGNTILRFEISQKQTSYHFAINIPSNKIEEAHNWQKEKTKLIRHEQNEIITFESWNARSIFFYDPENNIVEFIARQNLNNQTKDNFSENSFIGISEIGTPVINIKETFDLLNDNLGLDIYDGNFERFCAVGDENGLFVLIDKNNKKWFPSMDEAFFSPYKIKVENRNTSAQLSYKDGQLNFDNY